MTQTTVVSPVNARKQFGLLVKLWWFHMRRRPLRVGEQPKTKGAPTFLLLTLFRTVYLSLFVWQNVAANVKHDVGPFTWHIAGVLLFGFSSGLYKGSARLQLRGTRNDAFLEPLPLTTLARAGLQLSDSLSFVPMIVVVPLAALSVRGAFTLGSIGPVLLSVVAFVSCFAVGLGTIAWVRALGPAGSARWGSYVGVALNTVSLVVIIVGLGRSSRIASHEQLTQLANLWLGPHPSLRALYAASLLLGAIGYGALFAAEHYGFDQVDAPSRAPKRNKRTRDRIGLERVMMLRQGGRPLFIVFSLLVVGAVWVFAERAAGRLAESELLTVTTFVVYLGALQIIGQAGRAARGDLMARSFLAALPISPHQALDGKTQALRMLQIPVHVLLLLLGAICTWQFGWGYAYRCLLAVLSMHVVVEGAISVAFLSNDIGVVGVSGTQSGSDFSTTLLMLPLLATVMAPNAWSATTAFIAVLGVTWESRRAARMSVRWIDDPSDELERETTVWRALLAATAFFAVQALSYRMLSVFDFPAGYGLAIAFAASGVLLALLTWRNHTRIERPRFLPRKRWYWPLGPLLGASSGLLALGIAKLVPPIEDGAMSLPDFSGGELIAMSITMTVIAPLAEEYFFRGWLQRAIALDLPADKKRFAFVIGACVFALAHFGTYGVPQLVLGLIAGWLYASGGGLWPGILAHAAHNGIVLLLGS